MDYFIYDKSSISFLFSQMTFVLNSVLNWYDLRKDIVRSWECHMSYKLFWVGFILKENQLTTKDTKEHKAFNTLSLVTLCDSSW